MGSIAARTSVPVVSRAQDLASALAACELDSATIDKVTNWMVREGYSSPSTWAHMDAQMEMLALAELRKDAGLSFAARHESSHSPAGHK